MKDEIKKFSRHYTRLDKSYLESWTKASPGIALPPEQMPDDMLDRLVVSRNLNRAMWFLRQL